MATNNLPSFTQDATGLTLIPELSERQEDVLRFIYEAVHASRSYPTTREIASEGGYSQAAAMAHLNALVKKGYLTREPSVSRRNIRLTPLALEKIRLDQEKSDGEQMKLPM